MVSLSNVSLVETSQVRPLFNIFISLTLHILALFVHISSLASIQRSRNTFYFQNSGSLFQSLCGDEKLRLHIFILVFLSIPCLAYVVLWCCMIWRHRIWTSQAVRDSQGLKRWRDYRQAYAAFVFFLMWIALGLFAWLRSEAIELTGPTNRDNDWTFGQIVAVMAWVPITIELVYRQRCEHPARMVCTLPNVHIVGEQNVRAIHQLAAPESHLANATKTTLSNDDPQATEAKGGPNPRISNMRPETTAE